MRKNNKVIFNALVQEPGNAKWISGLQTFTREEMMEPLSKGTVGDRLVEIMTGRKPLVHTPLKDGLQSLTQQWHKFARDYQYRRHHVLIKASTISGNTAMDATERTQVINRSLSEYRIMTKDNTYTERVVLFQLILMSLETELAMRNTLRSEYKQFLKAVLADRRAIKARLKTANIREDFLYAKVEQLERELIAVKIAKYG